MLSIRFCRHQCRLLARRPTMETLAKQFHDLPVDRRRKVHLFLGEAALRKWRKYCSAHRRIGYVETVCGTRQSVDIELPADACQAAREGRDNKNVAARYQEPITAMQDDDLIFPEPVEYAYYALYNLFNKYAARESVDDWLIVNQALSSEEDESKRVGTLESAIHKAT